MPDKFAGYADSVSDASTRAERITPSDTTDLTDIPKGLYVGMGGDLAMIGLKDAPGATGEVWKDVPAGAVVPFRPRRILATGTTAANLLALY